MRRRVPMRRLLLALAAALAVLGPAVAGAVCGDANDDGRVTVSDGVQTLRAAAQLSSSCDERCDFDGSGAITVSDGVNVLRKAAQLPVVENCEEDGDPTASLIGHTLGIFGPLVKVGAVGGAAAAGTPNLCDNASGSVQDSGDGFVFESCDFGDVTFDGFLGTTDGNLSFNNLEVRRRDDVVTLAGSLSVGEADGNPELSGVLDGDSQQLGTYVVTFQQVVTDPQGDTLDGGLTFDTSDADIPNVVEVRVTLTGGTSLPVVVLFADDTTRNFTYDTTTDVLTPIATPSPSPTPTAPPTAEVRLFNIDDRITAFLNGKQVLQAASTGPGATADTGFVEVDGLTCGDNLFEFRVENTAPGSGYTFGVQLRVGDDLVVNRTCGTAGVQGCDGNNQSQGEVARDVTFVCVPCAPCTATAGSCVNPLTIPASGRIQIHGRVSGANNVSGPCDGIGGPESVFRFTPATFGCYQFATCGTTFDSQLSLGDAFCGGDGPIQETCFDDNQSCADGTSREFTFGLFNPGVPITLLLDAEGSGGGEYVLDVRPSGSCIF